MNNVKQKNKYISLEYTDIDDENSLLRVYQFIVYTELRDIIGVFFIIYIFFSSVHIFFLFNLLQKKNNMNKITVYRLK